MKIDDIHEMAHDINKYVNEHHMLKSLNQQLFDENERLNAIIDELEEKLNKIKDFINNWEKYKKDNGKLEVSMLDLLYIKEILGDKENE